uniref:5-hydroxytryptamine receptor 3A n=1 Tax=Oryzias sinensis TaxID=183150 RepID=A0A8C7X991_9TELE
MIEKDKAPPSPLLQIDNHGYVVYKNDQVIISTCQMHVYKFPFDTQSCNITFKSIFHRDYEISLSVYTNNTEITKWSRDNMRAQYEWVFKNITVQKKTEDSLGYNKTSVIYTISMSRRSTLYCFNFLVPILFLIILDMASLLIPDNGGEKLSFKVTVLLAVTVMQLILNEILPSSTETIPLVVLYCIGVFGLMLLSLMETIVVMHLMEKDSVSPDSEGDPTLNAEQNDDKMKVNCRNSLTGLIHLVIYKSLEMITVQWDLQFLLLRNHEGVWKCHLWCMSTVREIFSFFKPHQDLDMFLTESLLGFPAVCFRLLSCFEGRPSYDPSSVP